MTHYTDANMITETFVGLKLTLLYASLCVVSKLKT